jgi:hypothetical protein
MHWQRRHPLQRPESNYYVEFIKANSYSDPYASKTKLRPLSGIRSSLRRSVFANLDGLVFALVPRCKREWGRAFTWLSTFAAQIEIHF